MNTVLIHIPLFLFHPTSSHHRCIQRRRIHISRTPWHWLCGCDYSRESRHGNRHCKPLGRLDAEAQRSVFQLPSAFLIVLLGSLACFDCCGFVSFRFVSLFLFLQTLRRLTWHAKECLCALTTNQVCTVFPSFHLPLRFRPSLLSLRLPSANCSPLVYSSRVRHYSLWWRNKSVAYLCEAVFGGKSLAGEKGRGKEEKARKVSGVGYQMGTRNSTMLYCIVLIQGNITEELERFQFRCCSCVSVQFETANIAPIHLTHDTKWWDKEGTFAGAQANY